LLIDIKVYHSLKADIWSRGVILFVILAVYLPFLDKNLIIVYKKMAK
jgi:hypothetical protein